MNGINNVFEALSPEPYSVDDVFVSGACMGYKSVPCISSPICELYGSEQRSRILAIIERLEKSGLIKCSIGKGPIVAEEFAQFTSTICSPISTLSFMRSCSGGSEEKITFFLGKDICIAALYNGALYRFEITEQLPGFLASAASLSCCEDGRANVAIMAEELRYIKHLYHSFQKEKALYYIDKLFNTPEEKNVVTKLASRDCDIIRIVKQSRNALNFRLVSSDTIAAIDNCIYKLSLDTTSTLLITPASSAETEQRLIRYCD